MKRILTKLLVCLLIILILNNYFISNVAHAASMLEILDGAWGVVVEFIEDVLGTVVGIFAIIPKMIVLPLCISAQGFMASIAYSQGTSDADGNIQATPFLNLGGDWFLTPFDIIFNKVALTDVNIFNIPSTPGAIKSIREAAASWYYVMRNIAAAILLCVLIYVGIRMAISTVASDKAAYKKMLIDWACSLALIFLLQYIIVFTFAINTAFLKALENVANDEGISNAILKLYGSALWPDMDSIAATVVICMLTWQTISLLISYTSRMLKVTFLVIISPLITLTYSIDKMGDGKAQALNNWLKEFIYTVLLQPFHCIIYTVFVGIAMSILTGTGGFALPFMQYDNNNIGAAVLCVVCIHFVKEAEKILGKIFNFSDAAKESGLGVGMAATAVIASKAKDIGKGARSLANTAKNSKELFKNAKPVLNSAKSTMGTVMGLSAIGSKKKSDANAAEKAESNNRAIQGSEQQVKDALSEATKNANAKKTAKNENRMKKRIDDDTKKIMKKEGLSEVEARQKAVENYEKKVKEKEQKRANRQQIKRELSGFKQTWDNSDLKRQLSREVLPAMISMGTGIFVGAGSYGVGKSGLEAFTLGTSATTASKEFFKTSTRNITKDNADYARGAGVTTREGAQEYMQGIAGREDELKDISKSLSSLLNNITDKMGKMSSKEKSQFKGNLKNIIDQSLLKNPKASNADIMNNIAGNGLVQKGLSDAGLNMSDISGDLEKAMNLQRDAKVYQNLSNLTEFGLKPGVAMDETVKRFKPGEETNTSNSGDNSANYEGTDTSPDGPKEGETKQGEVDTEEEHIVEKEIITTYDDLPENVKTEIEEKIRQAVDSYKAELDKGKSSAEAKQTAVESIEGDTDGQIAGLTRKVLESEQVINKLKESNDDFESIIKTLRRQIN